MSERIITNIKRAFLITDLIVGNLVGGCKPVPNLTETVDSTDCQNNGLLLSEHNPFGHSSVMKPVIYIDGGTGEVVMIGVPRKIPGDGDKYNISEVHYRPIDDQMNPGKWELMTPTEEVILNEGLTQTKPYVTYSAPENQVMCVVKDSTEALEIKILNDAGMYDWNGDGK